MGQDSQFIAIIAAILASGKTTSVAVAVDDARKLVAQVKATATKEESEND